MYRFGRSVLTKSRKHLVSALIAGTFLGVSATSSAADSPYANMDKDEAGLWFMMDKIEKEVKTAGVVMKDPALNAYIQDVTCKVVGDACKDLRIYIVQEPVFNASMAPNGMMIVNSGLLLRAENEAQLGCVIGHEFGHFVKSHSLQQWRSLKGVGNANLLLPIAGALIGTAALSGYSRDHEREADFVGFQAITKNGYVSEECSKVWLRNIEEVNASSFEKVRKRGNKDKNGIFSSHPVAKERAETLKEMAKAQKGGENTGADVYRAKTSPYLSQWLEAELLAKDFDRHIYLFNALKDRGYNEAVMEYYLGEAYRMRRKEGDRDTAFEHWQKSSKLAGAPPEVWRALGEHLRKKKRKSEALNAYRKYLTLKPGAQDKALIEKYITRLSRET